MRIHPKHTEHVKALRKSGAHFAADLYEKHLVPTGAGTERAIELMALKAARQAGLYADTPSPALTRQMKRHEAWDFVKHFGSPHTYNRKTRRLLKKQGWDGEPVPGKSASEHYHKDAQTILASRNVGRVYHS